MRFSQRIGKTAVSKIIQIESMDQDLRFSLWNTFKVLIIDHLISRGQTHVFKEICKEFWVGFFKQPINWIPDSPSKTENDLKNKFLAFKWFEIYDFTEFIGGLEKKILMIDFQNFRKNCNQVFEQENSGYRFIGITISPITNPIELTEIEDAIDISGNHSSMRGANQHLLNSINKLSDKISPDYRNSIKESISAVESVAKVISGNKKDSLAGAIDKIKGRAKIHPALERGLKQIYGYTSDGGGIRHALMDENIPDYHDAKYMLVACSAFTNFLIGKASKNGFKL